MVWKVWLICWGKGDGQWGGNDFKREKRSENSEHSYKTIQNQQHPWFLKLHYPPSVPPRKLSRRSSIPHFPLGPAHRSTKSTKTYKDCVQLHFLLTFRLSTTIQNYPNTSNLLDFLRYAPKDSAPSASKSFCSSTPLVASASAVWQSGRNLKPNTVTRCIS